ncbi:hypothetical protein [Neobacillus sp. D3-1R]|uniref:hypothetical protein n=1 Tax=Neobacillus sp. D3-1R TaxID=3445778 RepID=UPI003FA18E8F
MTTKQSQHIPRHIAAFVSPYSINYLHLKNPWIPVWWSAAFPGLGQIMMCKYVIGFILICWEIFINQMAQINQAILLSMIGEFEKAKDVINLKWFLVYIPVYIYGMWDSYTKTVVYNKDYLLCYKNGYEIISDNINTLELNKLEKRNPLYAIIWSIFTPGMGYLYINRLLSVIIFFIWFIVIVYYSNLLPSIHFTMLGDFKAAIKAIDPQWFLYLPSLYLFVIYDSYVQTVEYNKVFDKEQTTYFKREYQDPNFRMPL